MYKKNNKFINQIHRIEMIFHLVRQMKINIFKLINQEMI